MKYIALFIVLTSLFASCKEKTREEKIEDFFNKLGIQENSSVSILNPDFCGSCTDFSIDWLVNKNQYKRKIVLSTGKLEKKHLNLLKRANYNFVYTNKEKISRLGIPLAVCTFVVLNGRKIAKMIAIKK